jgi:hypothetical protein
MSQTPVPAAGGRTPERGHSPPPSHRISQHRDARRQAKAFEAHCDLLPSLVDNCRRDNPVGVIDFSVALLSFVHSAPRAYWLKAGNAYLTFSTSAGTFPGEAGSR